MKHQVLAALAASSVVALAGPTIEAAQAAQPHTTQGFVRLAPGVPAGRFDKPMLSYFNYSFPAGGANGALPQAGSLVLIGSNLYGTTQQGGGGAGLGTVFKIGLGMQSNTESVLHSFGVTSSDGTLPNAGLLQKGAWLYGVDQFGGSGYGTAFRLKPLVVNPDSTYQTVWNFTGGSDGSGPLGTLSNSGSNIWATTFVGGNAYGTVTNINGNSGTACFKFSGPTQGANPNAGVIASGQYLYGTTTANGPGNGTVFKIDKSNPNNCTLVWAFPFGVPGNSGWGPSGSLLKIGNTLYGTTTSGGAGYGTIFSVNAVSGNPQTIYSFPQPQPGLQAGAIPVGPLIGVAGNPTILTGTTSAGGGSTACTNGCGTVFQYTLPNGPLYTLRSFQGSPDGARPYGGVIYHNYGWYGTTSAGGTANLGTVFALTCPSCQ